MNMSEDAIVAIGMMILLISGVFDLSVGSVLAFSGAAAASLMTYSGMSTTGAIFLVILACVGIGLFNGLLIAKIGVNPLIVTLAMMGVVRGMALLIAGPGITELPEGFLAISRYEILGIGLPLWYMVLAGAIFTVLMWQTAFFRRYFYIGGNEKAAALSGINVERMRVVSFMISAGLAGIAGIIITSRLGASIASFGIGLELRNITACILGGASLLGGQGTVPGAILGTLFMALVNNFMVISRMSISWQSIIISGILLIAVTLDTVLERRFQIHAE
jgi:ribose transport system permease protein